MNLECTGPNMGSKALWVKKANLIVHEQALQGG